MSIRPLPGGAIAKSLARADAGDRVELSGRSIGPSRTNSLVAARVDQTPDVGSASGPSRGAADSLQLYSRPEDRNAAATAVALGGSLDVTG